MLNTTISKFAKTLQSCFTSKTTATTKIKGKTKGKTQTRRLQLDPLEERQLLSLTPGQAVDLTVSQFDVRALGPNGSYTVDYSTTGDKSMAMSKDGSFVVTWTQEEPLWYRDSAGNIVADNNGYFVPYLDNLGQPIYEQNVYARYFTDETQRIYLPREMFNPSLVGGDGTVGNFSLRFGGNTVQRLSFYTATQPTTNNGTYGWGNISGNVRIGGIDATGDGQLNWTTFAYDESKGPVWNAANLQTAIRAMGVHTSGIKVTAYSTREFDIEFSNSHWADRDVPELQIDWSGTSQLTGFFASAMVTTINTPRNVTLTEQYYDPYVGIQYRNVGVPVYEASKAEYTAAMIEIALGSSGKQTTSYAPVNYYAVTNSGISSAGYFDDSDILGSNLYGAGMGWLQTQKYGEFDTSSVRVVPVYGLILKDAQGNPVLGANNQPILLDGTVFDITFIGDAGKQDVPELKVSSVMDRAGTQYVKHELDGTSQFVYDSGKTSTRIKPMDTIKEPSASFRVNAPEVYNSVTKKGVTDQFNSAVAISDGGQFAITWQSNVVDPFAPKNEADVYARLFAPYSTSTSVVVQDKDIYKSDGQAVKGIRAVSDQFRVNEYTNARQMRPSVGMDAAGNFLVTWETSAQDMSYFAGVRGRWYNMYGTTMTNEFQMTPNTTFNPGSSYVVVSPQGTAIVCYENVNNATEIITGRIRKDVYSRFSTTFHSTETFNGGNSTELPSIAFDSNERYVIAWTQWLTTGLPNSAATWTADVRAKMYQLTEAGEYDIRDEWRVNSTDMIGYSNWMPGLTSNTYQSDWFGNQRRPSVSIDADGDIAISFDGRGADMGIVFSVTNMEFAHLVNAQKNADLLPYFNFFFQVYGTGALGSTLSRSTHIDPDSFVRDFLSLSLNPASVPVSVWGAAAPSPATQEQTARINAVVESVLRKYRGATSDVLMSRYDADDRLPDGTIGSTGYLASDSVINNNRDGYNSKFYFEVNNTAVISGSINLRLYRSDYTLYDSPGYDSRGYSGWEAITVPLDMYANIPAGAGGMFQNIDIYETADNLATAINHALLTTATRTWDSANNTWWSPNVLEPLSAIVTAYTVTRNPITGAVTSLNNFTRWEGTPWELNSVGQSFASSVIFEVTFVGGAHDSEISLGWSTGTSGNITIRVYDAAKDAYTDNAKASVFGNTRIEQMYFGYSGAVKYNSSTSMTTEGSFVSTWTEQLRYTDHLTAGNILRYRTFTESTDTAGPMVTGMTLPNGHILDNNSQVSYALKDMVVNFNEDLYRGSNVDPNSLTNLDNWVLYCNGKVVENAIERISFGMNESMNRVVLGEGVNCSTAGVQAGTLMYGTNKWEAVITFKDLLVQGNYELVARNTLMDCAGNPLGKTGHTPFGADVSQRFNVVAVDGILSFAGYAVLPPGRVDREEIIVPANPNNHQFTRRDVETKRDAFGNLVPVASPYPTMTAANPQAIASDTRGNYVIVWTDTATGGIYGKKYNVVKTTVGGITTEEIKEISFTVTTEASARQASVAMDANGNIVVTWTQGDYGNDVVYFNYFQQIEETVGVTKKVVVKSMLPDGEKATGRVVSRDSFAVHQNPAVAMDATGGFTIVWESSLRSGGVTQGWDIYAQRFDASLSITGGTNEIQEIVFSGSPTTGMFRMYIPYYHPTTGAPVENYSLDITVNSNLSVVAQAIRTEFAKLGIEANIAVAGNRIVIQYRGILYGNRNLDEIYIDPSASTINKGVVYAIPTQKGMGGEYVVSSNPAVDPITGLLLYPTARQAGDQRFPKIAMTPIGNYIVTWTGVNAVYNDTDIFGRMYNTGQTQPAVNTFLVNEDNNPAPNIVAGLGLQTWSDVAIDTSGEFVVTWTTYDATNTRQPGIYVRRFDATGLVLSRDVLVSSAGGTQQAYSNISMNATGDFVISWETKQDTWTTDKGETKVDFGVFAKTYASSRMLGLTITDPFDPQFGVPINTTFPLYGQVGANGETSDEFRVNRTLEGDQRGASVTVSSSGDMVFAWSGRGSYFENGTSNDVNLGVFYRRYPAVRGSSAPYVTQVTAAMDGTATATPLTAANPYIGNPRLVTLYFSEPMVSDYSQSSVQSRSNWTLTRNGVAVPQTAFILVSYNIHPVTGRVSVALQFLEPLPNGDYVLTLSDRVLSRDSRLQLDGNYDGTAGGVYALNFTIKGSINNTDSDSVFHPTVVVNGNTTAGNQYTRDDDDADGSSTPRSVASDAEGNYFAVWTSEIRNLNNVVISTEIWGRKYRIMYESTDGQKTLSDVAKQGYVQVEVPLTGEIRLVAFAPERIKQPSVAMDPDGDIILVWAQKDDLTDDNSWNIYSKYLIELKGGATPTREQSYIMAKDPVTGSPVMPDTIPGTLVTMETAGRSQNPRVAMDVHGGYAIVWETYEWGSYGEDWNIYAQRYAPNGLILNTIDEVQAVEMVGLPTSGTFDLWVPKTYNAITRQWTGSWINGIQLGFSPNVTLTNVKTALAANGFNVDENDKQCDIEVTFNGLDSLVFRYVGKKYFTYELPQLQVIVPTIVSQQWKPGQRIFASTTQKWESGHFRVNETEEGNQRFPDIAMNLEGEFVITWTGWDEDIVTRQSDANIYARKYLSSQLMADNSANYKTGESPLTPLVVWPIGSQDRTVTPGQGIAGMNLDGVVQVMIYNTYGQWVSYGTGSLLESGLHILTAAHVVCDNYGNVMPATQMRVAIDTAAGRIIYDVAAVEVNEQYTGDTINSADIAVLRLTEVVPLNIAPRYQLYTEKDELGQNFFGVGYGRAGTAIPGGVVPAVAGKYWYMNTYEIYATATGITLGYDFDYIDATGFIYDRYGTMYGIRHAGLGVDYEGSAAPGDSGGPGFINGQIAGVVSYGSTSGGYPVIGGEGVYVRVSSYVDWITRFLFADGTPEMVVNQTTIGDQMWSSVGIDALGNFVITWTSTYTEIQQPPIIIPADPNVPGSQPQIIPQAPLIYDTSNILARRFLPDGSAAMNEFLVNDVPAYAQSHSQIAMSPKGDFTIAWEGYFDTRGSYNRQIVSQRYVNLMDGFVMVPITIPDPVTPTNPPIIIGYGYQARPMVASYGVLGPNGEIGANTFVNQDATGDQYGVSVGLNNRGDATFVWSSSGERPANTFTPPFDNLAGIDIFANRAVVKRDTGAPFVADVVAVYNKLDPITGNILLEKTLHQMFDNSTLATVPDYIIITVSEEMIRGINGIDNINNWVVYLETGGIPVQQREAIASVSYDRNAAANLLRYKTGKLEVVLTMVPGVLTGGMYSLSLKNGSDLAGNALDGDNDGRAGGAFVRMFYLAERVQQGEWKEHGTDDQLVYPLGTTTVMPSYNPVIASAEDGSFVVVSVGTQHIGNTADPRYIGSIPNGTAYGLPFIAMQRFDKYGRWDGSFVSVNTSQYMGLFHEVSSPDVAMDKYSNTVVVWQGASDLYTNGIFAKVFDSNGKEVGAEFLVNLEPSVGTFRDPKVAIQDDGTFLVTWFAFNTATSALSLYGRVFEMNGTPLNAQPFIIATGTGRYGITASDVAAAQVNGANHYAITWQSYNSTTKNQDVFATVIRVTATGQQSVVTSLLGGSTVSTYTASDQTAPKISFSGVGNGRIVITWSSFGQDGSDMGVFARAFDVSGRVFTINGTTSDCRLNQKTQFNQYQPDVSIARNGNSFVGTWTSYSQENTHQDLLFTSGIIYDEGVIARHFTWDDAGSGFIAGKKDDITGLVTGDKEEIVNQLIYGNQKSSCVTVDQNGDYSIAWSSYPYSYYPGAFTPLQSVAFTYYRSFRVNQADYARPLAANPNQLTATENRIRALTSQASTMQSHLGGGYEALPEQSYVLPEITNITGTNGNDTFRFVAASDASLWKVYLNDKLVTTIPKNSLGIEFDGLGGVDTVIFEGTDGADTVTLSALEKLATFVGSGYSVKAKNVTNVTVDGKGGTDTINVVSSRSQDTLVLTPDTLSLRGTGFSFTASGFETVAVTSGGGQDIATVYDSKGDDTVAMTPSQTTVKGTGFVQQLLGFYQVSAVSRYGTDSVSFLGTNSDDTFNATENVAALVGIGFSNQAQGFKNVTVDASGGRDRAKVVSTYGESLFVSSQTASNMYYRNGVTLSMRGFYDTLVTSQGSGDRAVVTAGSGASFVGTLNAATLSGSGLSLQLNGFSSTSVIGQSGRSIAQIDLTSAGSRTLAATATASGIAAYVDNMDTPLYQLIAFDKVNLQKSVATKGTLTLESSIDYLLATGNWEAK